MSDNPKTVKTVRRLVFVFEFPRKVKDSLIRTTKFTCGVAWFATRIPLLLDLGPQNAALELCGRRIAAPRAGVSSNWRSGWA